MKFWPRWRVRDSYWLDLGSILSPVILKSIESENPMDLGPHTGARLGTIGFSDSIDFYIHVTPYPLRGKGGRREIFGPAGGSVTLIG